MTNLEAIRAFFALFSNKLYNTGFHEPTDRCGVTRCKDENSMLHALAYMHGYADACRLAISAHTEGYRSPKWYIADTMGIACSTLHLAIECNDPAYKVQNMTSVYEAELLAYMAQL